MRFRASLVALAALVLSAAAPAELSLVDKVMAPGERSAKLFLDYRKATLILRPKSEGDRSVLVFQPNAGPALGIGVKLGPYLSGGFSRAVVPWQRDTGRRGRSSITHYELHWYKGRFGADLFHQSYLGMFLDRVTQDDLGVMGDALFKKSESPATFPNLDFRATGLNVFYTFVPDAFDPGRFMTQGGRPERTGWSPLVMTSFVQSRFGNDEPLVPADLAADYGDRGAAIAGGKIKAAALLPGVGGALVEAPWYASAVVFWGYAVQDYELYGSERSGKTKPASTGNLRGSIGYGEADWFGGLLGYKSIMTTESQDLTLTTTSSLVELHVGHRF